MAEREFKPMGIGDILDTSIKLYKGNIGRFLGAAAVVYVPLALLGAFISTLMVMHAQAATAQAVAQARAGGAVHLGSLAGVGFGGSMVMAVVFTLATMLVNAALIKMVSEAYLGRAVGIAETYSYATRRLMTVLGASLLATLVITVGYMLLVVPGVVFSLWLAFVTPVVVVEGSGAVAALKRSRALASGNLGKIFGLSLVLLVVALVVGSVFSIVEGAIIRGPGAGTVLLRTFLSQGVTTLLQPFFSACWILLYYDLRIRKEGFDLEMMAKSLGTPIPKRPSA
jgi:uncharacterized membrane protein